MKNILKIIVLLMSFTAYSDANELWSNSEYSKIYQNFLTAYNAGNKAQMVAFLKLNDQSQEPAWINESAAYWLDIHSRYGSMEPKLISRATPRSLEIWLQGEVSRAWLAVELIFDQETQRITATGVITGERPVLMTQSKNNSELKVDAFKSYLDAMAKHDLFSGVVLIEQSGSTLFEGAYGSFSDRNGKVSQIDANTRMRFSSITKVVTSVAILQLLEQGKINLDTPLNNLMKELPPQITEKLTVRDLLTHTSGYEMDDFPGFNQSLEGLDDIGAVYKLHQKYASKLLEDKDFKKSAKFNYSNENHDLLAVIIEKVTGIDFETYLNKEIFQPLVLQSISFENNDLAPATRYDYTRDQIVEVDEKYPFRRSKISGAAGLKGTARELLKLFKLVALDNGLLSLPYRSYLFTPATRINSSRLRSLVFEINYEPILSIGHNGTSLGNTAELRYFPDFDVIFVSLSNNRSGAQLVLNHFIDLLMEAGP